MITLSLSHSHQQISHPSNPPLNRRPIPQKDESCLPRLTTSLRIVEHLVLQHKPMPHQLALQLTECGAVETIIQLFESTCKMLERPWMEGRCLAILPLYDTVDNGWELLSQNLGNLLHVTTSPQVCCVVTQFSLWWTWYNQPWTFVTPTSLICSLGTTLLPVSQCVTTYFYYNRG